MVLQLDKPMFCDDFDAITVSGLDPDDGRPPQPGTPVFTDDSGRRAVVLQWIGRGLCALGVVLAAALTVIMRVQVPLPGQDGWLLRSSGGAPHPAPLPSNSSVASATPSAETSRTDLSTAGSTDVRTQPADETHATTTAPAATAGVPTVASPTSVLPLPAASASRSRGQPADNANPHATQKTRNPKAATPGGPGH